MVDTMAAEMCDKLEMTVLYEPETHTICSVVRDASSHKVAVVDLVVGLDSPSETPTLNMLTR